MSSKLLGGFAAIAATATMLAGAARAEQITYFRTDTPEFLKSAKYGKQLFEAYQCALCHATREGQPLTKDIIAPNLILTKDRLRPEWILEWIIDPQRLQPGTKMPAFFSFNEDDDYNPILSDADAHAQYKMIVALRDYLMVLGTEKEAQLDKIGEDGQVSSAVQEESPAEDVVSAPAEQPAADVDAAADQPSDAQASAAGKQQPAEAEAPATAPTQEAQP